MPGDPWQPDAPILEFDPAPSAVIEPGEVIEPIDVPLHVVLCFFQDVIATVVEELGGRVIDHVVSEIGRNPIYEVELDGRRLGIVHPGVGAPLAAGFLEELVARGCAVLRRVRRRGRARARRGARPCHRPHIRGP